MPPPAITSRQHPLVQRCRRLAAGKGDAGEVLLDGEHLVRDAVLAGVPLSTVMIDSRQPEFQRWLDARRAPIALVADEVLAAASPVRSPTGVVAIGRWSPTSIDDVVATGRTAPLVGVVDVQDPGNVGTIIRTADALGASGVLVLGASANPTSWRTLRAAAGGTFRIPVATGDVRRALDAARRAAIRIVAGVARDGEAPSASALSSPVLLLIGSEGAGLPVDILASADARVTVPMRGGVESLNAAVTAAILLWESARPAERR